MNNAKTTKQGGFTLVELAIVLVIIGLIIGGVLVGQDMIRSAEIRSTISQWEKYNAAVNTFRDKFGGYPGDLANAANFGFNARTGGDSDGLLEDCATGQVLGCENAAFFEDLAGADMIPEEITAVAAFLTANHTATTAIADTLPGADIGGGVMWSVYSTQGRNWYHLSGIDVTLAGPTVTDAIPTVTAYNIDNKIDDSVTNTGVVRAASARATQDVDNTDAATNCLLDSDITAYNLDENNAGEQDSPNCQLMIRMN